MKIYLFGGKLQSLTHSTWTKQHLIFNNLDNTRVGERNKRIVAHTNFERLINFSSKQILFYDQMTNTLQRL